MISIAIAFLVRKDPLGSGSGFRFRQLLCRGFCMSVYSLTERDGSGSWKRFLENGSGGSGSADYDIPFLNSVQKPGISRGQKSGKKKTNKHKHFRRDGVRDKQEPSLGQMGPLLGTKWDPSLGQTGLSLFNSTVKSPFCPVCPWDGWGFVPGTIVPQGPAEKCLCVFCLLVFFSPPKRWILNEPTSTKKKKA